MAEKEASPAESSSPHRNPLFEDGGPLSDPLERRTIFAALDSFHQYRKNTHYNTTHRRRQNLYALPSAQWQMLAAPPISILDTLNAVDDAIDCNGDLADAIFQLGLTSFGLSEEQEESSASSSPPSKEDRRREWEWDWRGKAKANDLSKAHSTIRQFYRDWSAEGYALEVKPLLDTILSDLKRYLRDDAEAPSLLLPGAGLGRILFELCLRGYNATGNEISYHQLLASNFILNATQYADQYPISPFAHTFTNVVSRTNQLRRLTVPDVHPASALSAKLEAGEPVGEMNMTAGDFVLSYSTPDCKETFDGVVSVFFIDTAPNLIRYVETVRNCLRRGGVWVNIGPLLWHFDDRVSGGGGDEEDDGDNDNDHRNDASQSGQKAVDGHNRIHNPTAPHDHGSQTHSPSHNQDQHQHHDDTHNHSHSHTHSHTTTMTTEDKGIAEPGSFELTDEEVIHLVSQLGFEILHHEILHDSNGNGNGSNNDSRSVAQPSFGTGLGYMQDPTSLLQNRYRCSHWVARKL
ncbi:hypothetical protein A1O1_02311 [Capronia coronata CBS 617.96]|uniref:carnosine N-methyltransferase n=1 Tax=Capronia coronata CBS 617.96 TaxID=1182541 RepID=W9YN14_9EURO|nr:uncharacterized protein A1O1_02311 [Capronia coronata CBS 617.96]EXJ93918.1 hypothetical protein A1O1_02311 [Capronia coronata CBS 617.96]